MTARTITIVAAVDACERPVVARAAARLEAALQACGDADVRVAVRFVASVAAVAGETTPDYAVVSLLLELAGTEPVAAVEARWRAALATWPATFPPALVGTIFRHVEVPDDTTRREALRERIRRLTLAAIEISHDTGANVVDFDRVLAHVGARRLASDAYLRSDAAIEVAARTLARAILALARDETIAPEVASCAEGAIGQPWDALPDASA